MARAQKSGGMSRFYAILAVVAVAGIAIVGYQVASKGGTAAAPVEVEGLDDQARLIEMAQGMVLGNPDAPVTIWEFGDFQCPSCRIWFQQVKNLIDVNYIQTGKARFVYYDWPITQAHPNAFLAARSSRCAAEQDIYWEYHKSLFDNQAVWSNLGSPIGQFRSMAEALGADGGDFEDCVRSEKYADIVTAQMRLGQELGVGGTPTVLVSSGGGRAIRPGSQDYAGISAVVEELLGES
ncbi:MAG: thioredoxin domain-containing protein [Gemmatimonadota bacterium]|nr:DsbA family protein [Gemmatimonadota bacterium]